MKKLIVANWKMNPVSLGETQKLIHKINQLKVPKHVEVVICPSFLHLPLVKSKFPLGAQDAFVGVTGPFTGEVSADMLKNIGVKYVILGHSERRLHLGETSKLITEKVKSVFDEGMEPILCVGEPLAVRKKGMATSKKFVISELKQCLRLLKPNQKSKVIVAYEPVWAISTMPGAKADTPEGAAEMIREIKKVTKGMVLYGGSVNGRNAQGFLSRKEIGGALVGGASLKPEEFQRIIAAAN